MISFTKTCIKYRNLIKHLVKKEMKIKYKGSFLGFFWTFLDPLFMILILLLVFTKLFRYNLENYPSYLLIGIFVWNYFSDATISGLHSLAANTNLVIKSTVPRESIVLSSNIFFLFDFMLKFTVLSLVLFILKFTLAWPTLISVTTNLVFIPVMIILQAILIFGFSLILSSFYLYLKDVSNLWGIIMHAGFFLTPIFYPADIIPKKYAFILWLNPMNSLIKCYRSLILDGRFPDSSSFFIVVIFSLCVLILGVFIFKKFRAEESYTF